MKKKQHTTIIDNTAIISFSQGRGENKRPVVAYMDKDVLDKLVLKGQVEGNSYFSIKSNGRVNKYGDKVYYLRYVTDKAVIEVHNVALKCDKICVVDHINHYTLDCRRKNLRIATYSQNLANRKNKGVYLVNKTGKFKLYGYDSTNGEKRISKIFSKEADALRYRREQELRRFEEYAYYPQQDFSKDGELLDRVIRKEITEEEALVTMLKKLAKNPWQCIRYGLEDELINRNIEMSYYYEDEYGFITREDGIHFRDI